MSKCTRPLHCFVQRPIAPKGALGRAGGVLKYWNGENGSKQAKEDQRRVMRLVAVVSYACRDRKVLRDRSGSDARPAKQ